MTVDVRTIAATAILLAAAYFALAGLFLLAWGRDWPFIVLRIGALVLFLGGVGWSLVWLVG